VKLDTMDSYADEQQVGEMNSLHFHNESINMDDDQFTANHHRSFNNNDVDNIDDDSNDDGEMDMFVDDALTTTAEATFVAEEKESPLVPSHLNPTELSFKVIVLAIVLSIVLASANTYLGLFAGITISVSIPSSILSLTLLKPFKANILEINAVQTGVSAGSSIAAGLIYTIPAMLMLQKDPWTTFKYGETFLIALIGGLMGVFFTIPLRRALIVENRDKLEFPEGKAITEVLKVTCLIPSDENERKRDQYDANDLNSHMDDELSSDSDLSDTEQLLQQHQRTSPIIATSHEQKKKGNFLAVTLIGIFCGVFMKLCQSGLALYADSTKYAWFMMGTVFYIGLQTSPALFGVGYIVKLRVAAILFIGGLVNSFVAIPILTKRAGVDVSDPKNTPMDVYKNIFDSQSRYIGVGCMLVGGITTFLGLSRSLVSSVKSSADSVKLMYERGISSIQRTDRDIPLPFALLFVGLCFFPVFALLMMFSGNNIVLSLVMSVFVLVAGFMFSSVGAYISGMVGSSNNPISGVTVATILTAAFVLLLWIGKGSSQGPMLSILIGSIVCCAAAVGGDNMQDLRTAYMIGATPWKVQVMQVIGLILPAFTLPLVLRLLLSAYGMGVATPDHANPLPAPQASLMATVTNSIFYGELPLNLVGIGMLSGVLIFVFNILVLGILLSKYTKFRIPILPIALGFYLPFSLTTPMLLGAITGQIAEFILTKIVLRKFGDEEKIVHTQQGSQYGLLYCAGLITGESLCGIALAIPIVISRDQHILAIFGLFTDQAWPGAILLTLIAALLIFIVNEKMILKDRPTTKTRNAPPLNISEDRYDD